MDPRLLEFYNRELLYIREMGGEFSRDFPKIAGRLGLDGFECADPYVERLLEGFAFLAARVHLKLDDEFPKFTDHLLEMVYPHYLCPTPSMAIVQFEADVGQGKLEEGFTLDRGTSLRSLMGAGDQTTCEYRTSQPVTLWPFNISEAAYASRDVVSTRLPSRMKDVKSVLRLRLKSSSGILFSDMAIDRLPIYIRGRDTRTMLLYEQIFADAQGVVLSWMNGQNEESAEVKQPILPMGFDDSQALLPVVSRSFQGYRMLSEYFAFQQRFLFFELTDLNRHLRRCKSNQVDIIIPFRRIHPRLENVVDSANFGLYCTPAINLFPHRADRIHVNDTEVEYHLVPDRTRPMDFEVHSVLGVSGYDKDSDTMEKFRAFYEVNDSDMGEHKHNSKYYAIRRTQRQLSSKQRRKGPRASYVGSEVYISIVDADQAPYASSLEQLDLRVMCTNRDLPLSMPIGKSTTDFTMETGAPVRSIRCLAGPTEPKPSFCESAGERSWRLISHLTLNYLSIVDGDGKGAAALREMLSLYQEVYETEEVRQSEGLVSVNAKPIVHRLSQRGPLTFGRGLEVTVTCDESRFEGSGVFLLGAVLSEFFSKYVSINSFTQTVLRTLERGEVMRCGSTSESPESLARLRTLQEVPYRFSLLSAIRMLDCILKDQDQTGKASRPSKESLRIGQCPSLSFAPSSIASVQSRASDGKWQLQTYFLGLFGPNGPLPMHFSDFADQRIKHHRDPTFSAFADMFHHRMASFFYRAWAESQPTVHLDRPESDRFSEYVASLCGLGMKPLRDRDEMPGNAKLFFAAHLASQTRHGSGLKSILAAFYKVNAELIPFVSHWVPLPEDCIWKIGRTRHSGELGKSITLGSRVRDCQQRFRIVLGPLQFEPFCQLLPSGASMKRLRSIVDQYVGLELTWDVQLVLQKEEVPRMTLGKQGQLGWTTWLSTKTPKSDADELIVNPIGRSEKYYKKPSQTMPMEAHREPLTSGV